MSETAPKQRPQFRNVSVGQILTYRLPPSAKVSILHRISGALLFLALPVVLLPILSLSLGSPETFESVSKVASNPLIKIIFLVLIRSEEHTSELQSRGQLVCRLLLEKKKNIITPKR